MSKKIIFFCKKCDKDIEVDEKEAEGYINWKCPDCGDICKKKGSNQLAILWKCSKGSLC
jgi:predicted RNA-binding Zn-ribbon protein involved in translation (DUF1610 family)